MMMKLGEEMYVAVFAIADRLDEAGAKRLQKMVIERVGMTPVLQPAIWRYPILDDVGGLGETMMQPFIFAQPLAESISLNFSGATVTDSWHEHQGFFLILCSCRSINTASLWRWLSRNGWKVVDGAFNHVVLQPPRKSWLKRWLAGT